MNMTEKYIIDLIERMNSNELVTNSNDSISWRAHREAEAIADISYYPILKELVLANSGPKYKKFRDAVYYIFGKLLKNNPLNEYIAFYLQQMSIETDKYILSSMLDRVADIKIPPEISTEILVSLAMHDKWLIRQSAIRALGASSTIESKKAIYYYINQSDEKAYKDEIIYANSSLGAIGSLEDIQILEQHIKSRTRDIRNSAEFAINRIKEQYETNVK